MITEKELNRLLDEAHNNLKGKFAPKSILFMDMLKHKLQRHKKLNDIEIAKLKDIANVTGN